MPVSCRLIDAHIHLWDLQNIRYPWLEPPFLESGINGNVSAIAKTYHMEDYLLDARGFDPIGIVHVEAGADPAMALEETRWLEQHLTGHNIAFSIVAFAALDAPDVREQLSAQCRNPHVRGIRQIVNWHANPELTYTPRNLLQCDAWKKGFSCLHDYDLSFDLQLYPEQMPDAATLAQENPQTRIIINHAGMPVEQGREGRRTWKNGMRLLAGHPNVFLKLSGFGLVDRNWTCESIRPFILEAIDCFGVERCMFASDFPTDKLHADFTCMMSSYLEIVAGFNADEKVQLFAANAARIYRIEGNQ